MRNKTFLIEDDAAAGMEPYRNSVDWDSVVSLAIRYKLRVLRQGAGQVGVRIPSPVKKLPEKLPGVSKARQRRAKPARLTADEIRRLVAERREAARG